MNKKKLTKIAKIFWFVAIIIVALSMIAFLLIPLFG